MDVPSVSVAMATFNGERFLAEQLASIEQQTRPIDELVVVDDASTDSTWTILNDWSRNRLPISLLRNSVNQGSTRSFERAIRATTGSIVLLCDQDDVWYPDKVEVLAAQFNAAGVGLVFSDLDAVGEDLRPLGYRAWNSGQVGLTREDLFVLRSSGALERLLQRPVITGAAVAFRGDLRDLLLPFPDVVHSHLPGDMIHDGWVAVMAAAVSSVVPVDRPLMAYRQHASQQIGVARETAAAPAVHATDFLTWARRLRPVVERLAEHDQGRFPVHDGLLLRLQGVLAHVEARAALPAPRLARIPHIVRECRSGRYARFSAGWRSVGRDLLRRGQTDPSGREPR